MEPYFASQDKIMFYKYLDRSTHYFEYGSGGSTYQATLRPNIQKIYSVESDKVWYTKLTNLLKDHKNITFLYHEMDTRPDTWGNPGPNSTPAQWKTYSQYLPAVEDNVIDLVLIDGRFRVACCLKCFDHIRDTCLIAFDDFLNRPHYHIVLDYYDIIEKTSDNRMVVLKKKANIQSIPATLIKEYERIKN